jgi:hypothetical protein
VSGFPSSYLHQEVKKTFFFSQFDNSRSKKTFFFSQFDNSRSKKTFFFSQFHSTIQEVKKHSFFHNSTIQEVKKHSFFHNECSATSLRCRESQACQYYTPPIHDIIITEHYKAFCIFAIHTTKNSYLSVITPLSTSIIKNTRTYLNLKGYQS